MSDEIDHGSCRLVRLDQERIMVAVRAPNTEREVSVSIPWDAWLKMTHGHRLTAGTAKKLAEFVRDHDPFGDHFSQHDVELIEAGALPTAYPQNRESNHD